MKTIDLKDAISGKDLHIEFDLDDDIMFINGQRVERKRPLEANDDEYVYGPSGSGPTEIHQLSKAQLNQIRSLWGLPDLP